MSDYTANESIYHTNLFFAWIAWELKQGFNNMVQSLIIYFLFKETYPAASNEYEILGKLLIPVLSNNIG